MKTTCPWRPPIFGPKGGLHFQGSLYQEITRYIELIILLVEETRGIIILSFYTEDATMKQEIKQSLPYGTAPGIEC